MSVVDGQQRLTTNYKAYCNHPDLKSVVLDLGKGEFVINAEAYRKNQVPVGVLLNKDDNKLIAYTEKNKALASPMVVNALLQIRNKIKTYQYTINFATDLTEDEQINWFEVLNNAGSRVSIIQMRFSKLKAHGIDVYTQYTHVYRNKVQEYGYDFFTPQKTNVSYSIAALNPAYGIDWLFGKETQSIMPGEGRTFRRKTARFWDIWPMPPKIEETKDVLFLDGIYLGRKACVLICCDEKNVLGWYLCRYEHTGAWIALMKRIAEPRMVVSDGGTGFAKALKKVWPIAKHQRCIFHVFCQIKRYTTSKPNTLAGVELYCLAKDLLKIKEKQEAETWVTRFTEWIKKYQKFLSEMTVDEHGNKRPTHERLLKAERSLLKLIKENTLFTYLDKEFINDFIAPSTNNRIEGGINSRLREMLRNHRGLSIERRIKAVYWWCYMHSPEPLSLSEIIKIMPTDRSIAAIYQRMNDKSRLEKSLSLWGDAIVWSDLHKTDKSFTEWD